MPELAYGASECFGSPHIEWVYTHKYFLQDDGRYSVFRTGNQMLLETSKVWEVELCCLAQG